LANNFGVYVYNLAKLVNEMCREAGTKIWVHIRGVRTQKFGRAKTCKIRRDFGQL